MPAKVPPAGIVRTVEGARARLQRMNQLMVPGPIALLELIMGSMITQAIYVAAKLDIAGILGAGPLTTDEIARRAGADPDATDRLLRVLASYSIFAEHKDGSFGLTPMAAGLRSDGPMTMRGMALLLGHPLHWEDWGHLLDAVRTGEPVLPKLRGMDGYAYLAANPEFAEVFEGGMGNLSVLETDPIVAAYDFSRFDTIVDVYGGRGVLLAAILGRAKKSRGVLFDWRADKLGAAELFAATGVADRCVIEPGGGLFEKPPSGGDAYILKHIVHEWPEDKALEILRAVRGAISENGRLLMMEFVLPEGKKPHPGRLVDLWLMILMGGKERTSAQYADLLGRAGFRLTRVVGTASPVAIIEARPS
jgi:hypothetical protein